MAAAIGNQYAAKAKQWSLAIERAVAAWPDAPKGEFSGYVSGLNSLAHEFVKKIYADKDIAFFREIGDRLDGKPAQTVDVGNKDGEEFKTVSRIELVPLAGNANRED